MCVILAKHTFEGIEEPNGPGQRWGQQSGEGPADQFHTPEARACVGVQREAMKGDSGEYRLEGQTHLLTM